MGCFRLPGAPRVFPQKAPATGVGTFAISRFPPKQHQPPEWTLLQFVGFFPKKHQPPEWVLLQFLDFFFRKKFFFQKKTRRNYFLKKTSAEKIGKNCVTGGTACDTAIPGPVSELSGKKSEKKFQNFFLESWELITTQTFLKKNWKKLHKLCCACPGRTGEKRLSTWGDWKAGEAV
jgi:hypothetical protein